MYEISHFEEDKEYELSEIKSNLGIGGGFLARGINPVGRFPNYRYVVLISKHDGPYPDSWDGRMLEYCGEGQHGDQQLTRGNKALEGQKLYGYPVLVFRKESEEQKYRFLGSFDVSQERVETVGGRNMFIFSLARKPSSIDQL